MADSINTINVGGIDKEVEDTVARTSGTSANSRCTALESGLSNLTARVDEIVAPSGEAPSAAEVADARITADDKVKSSLGNAIRYQVNSIYRGSVDLDDLDYIETPLTSTSTTENAFPTQYGTVTTGASGYRCIEYNVAGVEAVRIKSYSVAAAVAYVFLDNSNAVLDYFKNTLGGAIRYYTKKVVVPPGAVKLLITDSVGNASQTFGLANVSEISPLYSKVSTSGGASDNVITPRSLHEETMNFLNSNTGLIFGDELTAKSSGTGFMIINTSIPSYQPNIPTYSDDANYTHYEYSVDEGDTYVVQTFHAYALKAWYILDSDGLIIDYCPEPTSNKIIYSNHLVTIPKHGKTLVVNWGNMRPEQKVYETAKVYKVSSYNARPTKHHIGVIGDSLSAMVADGVEPPNYTDKWWWQIVGERLNSDIVCVAQRGGGYKHNSGSFLTQISAIRDYCDIVVVFGSGNDMTYWDSTTKYGSIDDEFTNVSDSSVMACMKEFFKQFRISHPTKKLIVFSPTLWNGYDPVLNNNPRMIDYSAALKEVCEHFAVPFYDMTLQSGFIPSVETFREAYTVDGTHLNTAGHAFVAPFFIDQISKCIL